MKLHVITFFGNNRLRKVYGAFNDIKDFDIDDFRKPGEYLSSLHVSHEKFIDPCNKLKDGNKYRIVELSILKEFKVKDPGEYAVDRSYKIEREYISDKYLTLTLSEDTLLDDIKAIESTGIIVSNATLSDEILYTIFNMRTEAKT